MKGAYMKRGKKSYIKGIAVLTGFILMFPGVTHAGFSLLGREVKTVIRD